MKKNLVRGIAVKIVVPVARRIGNTKTVHLKSGTFQRFSTVVATDAVVYTNDGGMAVVPAEWLR